MLRGHLWQASPISAEVGLAAALPRLEHARKFDEGDGVGADGAGKGTVEGRTAVMAALLPRFFPPDFLEECDHSRSSQPDQGSSHKGERGVRV
jgi:hypothetical protein